jgi:elongation factor G
MFLDEKMPSPDLIEAKIRQYTLERKFIPVFMGSAYKNKGVQLALDGVIRYLPSPPEKPNHGFLYNKEKKEEEMLELPTDDNLPFVGYVFKLEESRFGQLTYIRVYQGKLKRGDFVWNDKMAKKVKVSRIVKMHANNMEEIEDVKAGDIFAIFGVECATGDTLTQADNSFPVRCQRMFVPDPVMSLTINPNKQDNAAKLEKALAKFKREDPTFSVTVDRESEEMIISGMG